MSIEELFKYAYVITVNEERLKEFKKNFQYYNLPTVNVFYGSRFIEYSHNGCGTSHLKLLKYARDNKFPYILIFEDDAYPRKDIKDRLNYYLNKIPHDCGILSFGYTSYIGSFTKHTDFITFNNYEKLSGAHAYIVFKNCYDYLINALEKYRIADQVLSIKNFYIEAPMPYWTIEQLFIQKNISNQSLLAYWKKFILNKHVYVYADRAYKLKITDIPPENFEIIP